MVIADGVYSSLITRITGTEVPLVRSGRSVYRTSLIPIAELSSKYPKASETLELQTGCTICGHMDPTTGKGALMYPCRSGSMLNFLIFHPSQIKDGAKDRWNMPGDLQDAKAVLEKSNTSFQAVLNSAVEVREYDMAYRDALPNYHNNRAIIVGDAAHPMLPMHAADATSALEDAVALEVLLFDSLCAEVSLAQLLELWQALCLPRDATVQILSNTASERPGFSTRPIETRIRQYYRGHLPDVVAIGWSKETTDFLMSYDAFKEADKALKWAHETPDWPAELARDNLPEGVVPHFGIDAVAE